MSIYQDLKSFGKNALLIGGLVGVLSGCSQPRDDRTQIFRDVNNDGRIDLVYLREFYPRTFFQGASARPDYELVVAFGKVDGTLDDTKSLMQFGSEKPLNLQLEDLNADGNLDLVYLREFYPRTFFQGASARPDYELRVANGRSDGTFEESRVIKSYGSEKPIGLN